MKHIFLSSLMLYTLNMQAQDKQAISKEDPLLLKPQTTAATMKERIVVFPYTAAHASIFPQSKPANLLRHEWNEVEDLLIDAVFQYNLKTKNWYQPPGQKIPASNAPLSLFSVQLHRYNRQYITATNDKGEKLVWVNCLHERVNNQWRKKIVRLNEDNMNQFELKINLSQRRWSDFKINGKILQPEE